MNAKLRGNFCCFSTVVFLSTFVHLSSAQRTENRNNFASVTHWENIASSLVAGENHERHRGSAWCDFDNDGFMDLYLSHFGQRVDGVLIGSPNQLLKNVGNGEFVDVTTDELAIGSDLSHHSAWADVNNDGLVDLFVGQSTNFGEDRNYLLQQTSTGEFLDITNGDPLAMYWMTPRGVAWQDIDNDGLIDLCVANSGGDNQQNWIMMNVGGGKFERIDSALNQVYSEGRGVAWCDYDNDGLPDVYITNGSQDSLPVWLRRNALFKNLGNGEFKNVAEIAGVADPGHGRGVVWGDVNNDGWMDILVGNSLGSDIPAHNRLFKNNGDGTFTDITVEAGIYENIRTRGVSMADFDNDGYLDMYVVSFGTSNPYNRLFRNNGDATFTNVASGTLAEGVHNDATATWTDVDNDGWLELYTVGGSPTSPGVGQNQLLKNMSRNSNNWIEIELCGTTSNRTGIGTRVTVLHETANGEMRQIRDLQSGYGYNAQDMLRIHFGLADSLVIAELAIEWPSGITHSISNVNANQIIRIVEDEFEFAFDCNRNCQNDAFEIEIGEQLDINQNGIPDDCECLSDFNQDGVTGVDDLLIFLAHWGPVHGGDYSICDLDGNEVVNVDDLLLFIANWGDC